MDSVKPPSWLVDRMVGRWQLDSKAEKDPLLSPGRDNLVITNVITISNITIIATNRTGKKSELWLFFECKKILISHTHLVIIQWGNF